MGRVLIIETVLPLLMDAFITWREFHLISSLATTSTLLANFVFGL